MLLTTVAKYVIIGDTLYEVELSYNQGAMMEKLQQKVKALRLKKGWAQEDLARQINVSLSTVQLRTKFLPQ
jgi:DNA-binding transcriptional regulator YiaG